MSDHLGLAAYALAAEVDRRNGEPPGTCQPMTLTAFVIDLRQLAREEIPRAVVDSSTPTSTR